MLAYRILRKALLALTLGDVELASILVLNMLDRRGAEKWVERIVPQFGDARLRQEFFGLMFENPVGLAAGLTKDCVALPALQRFGFGFIEGGGVIPYDQYGNGKDRMFDLPQDHALVNSLGFPSRGMGVVAMNVRSARGDLRIPFGVNIGVNKGNTSMDRAISDYQKVMIALYHLSDFFVVNISSPNTEGLRQLGENAPVIIRAMQDKTKEMSEAHNVRQRPVLYKLSGDISFQLFGDILGAIVEYGGDGVVLINTTTSRGGLLTRNPPRQGGLSGPPLFLLARDRAMFAREFSEDLFIIGVGGIPGPQGAIEMLPYVNLIQVLTGFVTHDPFIGPHINKGIVEFMAREQMTSIADFRQLRR